MTDLSVVILAYKEDPAVLRAYFRSLTASRGVTVDVIVVDNGNRTTTSDMVRELLPGAQYIANRHNRGFAAAVNQGISRATGRYVLLLNPDTEFAPHVLATMVAHMDADTEVGIGTCLLTYPDGSAQESIRRFPTLRDQLITLLKLPHVLPRLIDRYMMRDVDLRATQDVETMMGAFMMIRRDVIDHLGGLDERYFIWFEEVDYCKMAHAAGWKIRHYADVVVMHHKGHTFNQLATIRKQTWMRQSMRKYFRKHHGVIPWLILWLSAPLFIVLGYAARLVKRK